MLLSHRLWPKPILRSLWWKKWRCSYTVCSFLGLNALNSSADVLVTGAYAQQNNANQVMSVGKTQMQIGATDRAHANYINARSSAGRASHNSGSRGGADFQWRSSQTENLWKTWRIVEDTGNVTGLVVGDCRGDNSTAAYFKRMNISRKRIR